MMVNSRALGTFYIYFLHKCLNAPIPTQTQYHVCVLQMKNYLQKCKDKWNKNLFTV